MKAGGQLSSTASQQLNLSRTPSLRSARNGGTKMGLFACLMRKQAAWNNAKIQFFGRLLLLHTQHFSNASAKPPTTVWPALNGHIQSPRARHGATFAGHNCRGAPEITNTNAQCPAPGVQDTRITGSKHGPNVQASKLALTLERHRALADDDSASGAQGHSLQQVQIA